MNGRGLGTICYIAGVTLRRVSLAHEALNDCSHRMIADAHPKCPSCEVALPTTVVTTATAVRCVVRGCGLLGVDRSCWWVALGDAVVELISDRFPRVEPHRRSIDSLVASASVIGIVFGAGGAAGAVLPRPLRTSQA